MKAIILLCACLTAAILSGVSLLLYQNRHSGNFAKKNSVGITIPDELYAYQLSHAGIATISRAEPIRDPEKDMEVETIPKTAAEQQHKTTAPAKARSTEKLVALLQPAVGKTRSVADRIKTIEVTNSLPTTLVSPAVENNSIAAAIKPSAAVENIDTKDRATDDKLLKENALTNYNSTTTKTDSVTAVSVVQQSLTSFAAYNTNNTTAAPNTNTTAVKSANQSFVPSYAASMQVESGTDNYAYMTLFERAEQLKTYAEEHGYNNRYAFMVNMGMKSGKKRFFVIDLSTMVIVKSGIVAHGRGNADFTLDKKYSNDLGSNSTALGMYKVGKYYTGNFGAGYRLFGLEKSNDNAYKRAIVLHAMHCIPNDEIDRPIYQTEGCPAVSPQFFNEISSMIDSHAKPMLLWIFDPSAEGQHGNETDNSVTQISTAK